MKICFSAALIALGSLPITGRCQERNADTDGEYVVTSSRQSELARDSIHPVTVITAQEIRDSGAGSVIDLLRTFGGVEVSTNGGLGQASDVFIRGANSDHTVVLVDGVRIGSATLGTAPLESIPLDLIDRIEILPGPSSSLYGADAIGGVIQIFTRSAQRSPGLEVDLTGGTYGLVGLDANWAGTQAGNTFSLAAGALRTRGYDVTTAAYFGHNPDSDGYANGHVLLNWVRTLSTDSEIGASFMRSQGRVRFDDGPIGDSFSDNVTQTVALHWKGRLVDGIASELTGAQASDLSNVVSASAPGHFDTRQDQVSWLNRTALIGGTATAGVEWLRQSISSTESYGQTGRQIPGVLLGWRGQPGGQGVQIDLRHDWNNQFGGYTTGQAAWATHFTRDWRVRASYGTAFHPPSFNELYFPGFGNPSLHAERSRSAEVGVDGRLGAVELVATAFQNRIRDLIDYTPPNYIPVNVARARIEGLSLQAQAAPSPATRIRFNATMQQPKDEDTGLRLPRRARAFGGASVTQRFSSFRLGAEWAAVGRRFDSANESPDSSMGGYGLVNVFGSWTISPDWKLDLRIDNLTGKDYVTAVSFVPPPRRGQMILRWTPAF
jgi:vitamin B12 transporter